MFVQNICKEFHNDLSQMCLFHPFSSGPGFQGPGLFLIPVWLKFPVQWSVRCPNSCWCAFYFPHHVDAKETRTLNATDLEEAWPGGTETIFPWMGVSKLMGVPNPFSWPLEFFKKTYQSQERLVLSPHWFWNPHSRENLLLADVRWRHHVGLFGTDHFLIVVMYHTTRILSLNPNQFNLPNNHIWWLPN